ncbi:hypothetical protein [Nocardia callitridis]
MLELLSRVELRRLPPPTRGWVGSLSAIGMTVGALEVIGPSLTPRRVELL